jgi:hypothetical protein
MEFLASAILTPYNYFNWKPRINHMLMGKGLYRIAMATKKEPTLVEKSKYFNCMDEAYGLLCMSILPTYGFTSMHARHQMRFGPPWLVSLERNMK